MPSEPTHEVRTIEVDWETLVLAHDPPPGYYEAYHFGDRTFLVYDENDPLYTE